MEIRNTIAQFEEPAPLFGFLRYRRRNVVIKYVPEDCSRLVQGELIRSLRLPRVFFFFLARSANTVKPELRYISMPLRNDFLHTIPSFP